MKPLKIIEWRGARYYVTRSYPFLAEVADRAVRRHLEGVEPKKICGVDVVGAPLIIKREEPITHFFRGVFIPRPTAIVLTPIVTYDAFWHEVVHYMQLCLEMCDVKLFMLKYEENPSLYEEAARRWWVILEKQIDVAERKKVEEEVKRARYELQKDVWKIEVSTSP